MDNINSAINFVMVLGPIVWKYVKYQTCHNDYISEFKDMQEKLKQRQSVIDANLKTQLLQPGKIKNKEVEAWLEKVHQETAKDVVEDLVCTGGYFTNIRSSRKLVKKIEELKQTFELGEKYTDTGVSLVVDDHSIKHCVHVFKENHERLEHQKESIEAKTLCMQPRKIARKEVEESLENQRIAIKVEDLINQGESSSSSNPKKKIEELKKTFEQGEKYTNAGVSLVVDDHSIEYCAPVFKENQERLGHQKESIEAILKTQCTQPGKIARKEVEEWLEKASQQIAIKVEDLINQGESSSSSNLKKKIEEWNQTFEQGERYTNAGVSLVVDDHSIALVFKENQEMLEHHEESIKAIFKASFTEIRKIAGKGVEEVGEIAGKGVAEVGKIVGKGVGGVGKIAGKKVRGGWKHCRELEKWSQ